MSSESLSAKKKTHKELTIEERGKIIGAYQCGIRPATIARTFDFPPPTVYGTVRRYKKTGSAQPKPRPGRKEKLNDRDRRVVKRTVLAGRHRPLREITNEVNASLNKSLCVNTVRRYMAKEGFHSHPACKKPLLRKKTSKPDWRGARSAERGTRSGRRWSFLTSRSSPSSRATDVEEYGAHPESGTAPSV
jgi:transposase